MAARDPMGIRPMFYGYSKKEHQICFASEAKALFDVLFYYNHKTRANSASKYLHKISSPYCSYNGIKTSQSLPDLKV